MINNSPTMKMFAPMVVRSLIFFGLISSSLAEIVLHDKFDGSAGVELEGRSPDVVKTSGSSYTTMSPKNQLQLDGSGKFGTIGDGGIAWLALPKVSVGQVITVTAKIHPSSGTENFIAIGFTDGTGDLITRGVAWALLTGEGDIGPGRMQVFSGEGTSGRPLYESPAQEAQYSPDTSTEISLAYNTSSGNLKVNIGSDVVFEGAIEYNGSAELPPLTAFSHLTVQLLKQDSILSGQPGYIEEIKVDISK